MTVRPAVTLHAHASDVGKENDRALPDGSVQACRRKLFARNGICLTQDLEAIAGDLTDDADTESGTGGTAGVRRSLRAGRVRGPLHGPRP